MIIGIGTDILKIDRITTLTSDLNDPFIFKIYTQKEIALILSRPDPRYSFATRFSGKEAVFKALSVDGNSVRLNEIEILELETGQPIVKLYGNAKKIALQKGIVQILVSLSYDTNYAIAYATCMG